MVNVVFHTAFIGDLLLSIPFLRAIKSRLSGRNLILVTRPGFGDFFKYHGLADEVIELDKKSRASVRRMRERLKAVEIENLFCPHQSFRSAWILRNVSAKNKISYYSKWNGLFFNNFVDRDMTRPEVLRLMDLLAVVEPRTKREMQDIRGKKLFLNIHPRTAITQWPENIPVDLTMKIPVRGSDYSSLERKLKLKKPYVLIAPSSQWRTKRWTQEGFETLAAHYAGQSKNIYFIGSPTEKEECLNMAQHLTARISNSGIEIRSLAGETNFLELHVLMSEAECVFANDSGPMHMATVAGTRVVAVFGPTTLELGYRPWSDLARVAQVDLSCRPCGKHGHNKCPIQTHDCMKKVTAGDVVRLAEEL